MPIQDRRRFHGHGPDLSSLILGIGEAVDPTTENPYFGKPGDIPFDQKVDATKVASQPFKGFNAGPENVEAAQQRLALDAKNKADQVRRSQIIAEQTAEEARQREMAKQAGTTALLDFKNATGVSDMIPMSAADPMVRHALFGNRGEAEGFLGSSPRLAATMGSLPYERDIAEANAGRQRQEAEVGRIAAEDNPAMIRDASLAHYLQPALAAESMAQENRKRAAQSYADSYVPMHPGYTATGANSGISLTPETHGGFQPNAFDDKGNPTGFGYVGPKGAFPQSVKQLPNGKFIVPGVSAFPPAKPTAAPAPAVSPTFGPEPPPSLTPSALNRSPIQDTGLLPTLINRGRQNQARTDIEEQTAQEAEAGDRAPYLRDFLDFYWHGPKTRTQDPTVYHKPLRLTPAY